MTAEQGARLLELIETQNKILEEIAKQGRAQCEFLNNMGKAMVVIADSIMPPKTTDPTIHELLSGLPTQETLDDIATTLTDISQVADNWERDQAERECAEEDIHYLGDET